MYHVDGVRGEGSIGLLVAHICRTVLYQCCTTGVCTRID